MKKKTISEQHPEKYASKLTTYSCIFLPERQMKIKKKKLCGLRVQQPHRCFQKHFADNSNLERYSPFMNPFSLVNRTCLYCFITYRKLNKNYVKLCSPLFIAW